MAITTLDGLIAGFQPPWSIHKVGITMELIGNPHSFFYSAGFPGAGVAPTPGLNGEALTSVTGQIPYTNPSSGNGYLARFVAQCSAASSGTLLLCDRLWQNSSIVSATTTEQAIGAPVALPARDRNGSTNGEGVMFALEVSTATTNGGAITNTTLNYTNSAGTDTRTGTITSFPASSVVGTFAPFNLQAGDLGIRQVDGITLGTSYGTGVIHLVAYRVITRLRYVAANTAMEVDPISGGLPRMYDNSCPFLVCIPSATTAVNIQGQIVYAHG